MLLSVCMIVKNEEEVLERCLESIKGAADELIIIDTGSTDRTREIAAKYTTHIYDYEWTNDFSAARNEGIKRATSKWVLVMDADEYFELNDIERLRPFLESQNERESAIYSVKIISFVGKDIQSSSVTTGNVARLFPNNQGIFYHRPIHEQLISTKGSPLLSLECPVPVYHTGYLKEVVESKNKQKRNADIFTTLKNNKGFNAYDFFTVGNECSMREDYDKAIYYYTRSLEKIEKQPLYWEKSWYPHCVVSLIQCYIKKMKISNAWQLIHDKLSRWNDYPEYWTLRGQILYYFGLFAPAKESFEKALAIAEKRSGEGQIFWLISADFSTEVPLKHLHLIASQEGDTEKNIYYLTKTLIQNPGDYSSLYNLVGLLLLSESAETIIGLMDGLIAEQNEHHHLALLKVSMSLGAVELAEHYYNKLKEAEAPLRPIDSVNYHLLLLNEEGYAREALTETLEQDDKWSECRLLASLVWKKREYFRTPAVEKDDDLYTVYSVHEQIADQQAIDFNDNPKAAAVVYNFLVKCYHFRQYELYDELVNRYSDPSVINLLANFFYAQHQFDVAGSYYSILLRDNQLNGPSCKNLALYHLNNQLIEEGMEFLEVALKKQSEKIQPYVWLFLYANDRSKKQVYRKKFEFDFPQYVRIDFIRELIES